MPRPSTKPIQLLKGFKDILPEHQKYWEFFMDKAKFFLDVNGFERIDIPVLEQTNLYVKGTGKHTDIVEKELYSFQDKGDENITVRPEFTPGICRAYIEHGMLNKSQPVKLYASGPVFRHDNPQSGRYRQFNQLNLEVIGSDSPVLDAQLIIFSSHFLESLGLPVIIQINSIGCPECRSEYILKFKQYLSLVSRKKELCQSCRERYTKNPLRILDCKEESCQEVLVEAPQIVDSLCEDCKKHFMQVLEYLDGLEIKYNLNVKLVRGLDYYTRTTFEAYLIDEDINKSQGALLGGGRFDGLIEILGGRPTPAVGMAVGIERVISKLRELKIEIPEINKVDVFIAQLGVDARKECFKLHQKLSNENIKIGEAFSKDGLKNQLERADQMEAKLTLILGQKELIDKTIIIRDMQSGIQEVISYDLVVNELKKRINSESNGIKSYKIKSEKKDDKKTDDEKEEIETKDSDNQKKNTKPRAGKKYQLKKEEEEKILNENDLNNINNINEL